LAQQAPERTYSPALTLRSDSGYASGSYRGSVSTFASAPRPDKASVSDVRTNLMPQGCPTPPTALSNTACATPVRQDGIRNQRSSNLVARELCKSLPSRPKIPPNNPQAQSVTNESARVTQRAGPSGQPPTTRPYPRFDPSGYKPPHGPPSQCRLAQIDLSVPNA